MLGSKPDFTRELLDLLSSEDVPIVAKDLSEIACNVRIANAEARVAVPEATCVGQVVAANHDLSFIDDDPLRMKLPLHFDLVSIQPEIFEPLEQALKLAVAVWKLVWITKNHSNITSRLLLSQQRSKKSLEF